MCELLGEAGVLLKTLSLFKILINENFLNVSCGENINWQNSVDSKKENVERLGSLQFQFAMKEQI